MRGLALLALLLLLLLLSACGGHVRFARIIPPPYPPQTVVPVNVVLPTVSGTAAQGQVLSDNHGTWTGDPRAFSYQWRDCNSSGAACVDVGGATSSTYTLGAGDVGGTVRVVETASNAIGSASATSFQTVVVAATGGSAPINTASPTVSGTTKVEATLTASAGTWTNSPSSYTYQWYNCDLAGGSCAAISGASTTTASTTATHTVEVGQGGNTVEVQVTATNGGGASAPATSSATGTIDGSGYGTCSGSCTANTSSLGGGNLGWARQHVSSFNDTTVPTCSCTPNSITGTNSNPGAFEVYVPQNLVTNNSNARVPLVILADDGGFSGSIYESNWAPQAVANKFIAVDLSPSYNAAEEDAHCPSGNTCGTSYAHPYVLPTPDQNACGSTFTGTCDMGPYVNAVIAWAESNYQIDSQMIYMFGGSKGGTASEEMMCDTAQNPTFAGVAVGSSHYDDNANSVPPYSPRCPAMAGGSSSTYHHISPAWWWGDNDSTFVTNCLTCWTVGFNKPPWQYSMLQGLTAAGNAEGCDTSSPDQGPVTIGGSGGTAVKLTTYGACSFAQRLGLLEFSGSSCHADGCHGVQGVNLEQVAWDYWTTGRA